jgi:hypothetical protein
MPRYRDLAQSTITTLGDGTKVFIGPRDDPFFVDLAAIFDLLTIRRVPGNRGGGVDGVGGYDVMSVVLQIPKTRLTKDGQAPSVSSNTHVIGIWDTAERLATRTLDSDGSVSLSGPERQVSRLGMPLVNEVVIPLGQKDQFNRSEPADDVANFGGSVVDPELAKLFNLIYHINVPPAPRNDLVAVFATGVAGLNQPAGVSPGEMLRLNMTIPPVRTPNRLGVLAGDVAGFPNGRRLGDDVIDIEERVVAGVLVPGFNVAPNNQLGDGINENDLPFLPYFPYVAPPQNPFDHEHHAEDDSPGRGNGHGRGHHFGHDRDDRDAAEPDDVEAATASPKAGLSFAGANPARTPAMEFAIARTGHARLLIFDLQGRTVRTLVDQDAAAGSFRATWDGRRDDGSNAGKGVFFARLSVDGQAIDSKKIVLE